MRLSLCLFSSCLILFSRRLFDYDDEVDDSRFDGDEGKEIMEALDRVLDVLCMDFTGVPDTIESLFYSFGGIRIPKRPGRRRRKRERTEDGGYMGHGVFEPYVKMEVCASMCACVLNKSFLLRSNSCSYSCVISTP